MTSEKSKSWLDKLPLISLQLIAILYLTLIGLFLPTYTLLQFAIKLLIMGLGLFALLKLYDWRKESRKITNRNK